MNWIRNKKFICFKEGRAVILAEIQADSTSDFPTVNAYDNYTIAKGSVAQDISTGDFYCLNSSGVWVNQTTPGTTVDNTPAEDDDANENDAEENENA